MLSNKLILRNVNQNIAVLLIIISATLACNVVLALEPQEKKHGHNSVSSTSNKQSTPQQGHTHKHSNEHAMHKKLLNSPTVYARTSVNYTIPNVTLLNMHNEPVSLIDELTPDTPIMVNFIFTTCTTICPIMSATFSQLQSLLGDEADKVRLLSISIDPEQDTPEKLRAYARKFSAGETWHFLTGQLDDILTSLKALDAYNGSKMNHQPATLLRASSEGKWIRIEGMTSAKDLLNEYRLSMAKL